MSDTRTGYPSDVTDEEWAFVAPHLTLMRDDAPQRQYPLRDLFNGLRYVVKTGCQWRMLPHDFPPWAAVYQQARRWLRAGCFEAIAHELREVLRVLAERGPTPTAAILDGRTLQSTPESGGRAGYDGHKKKNGSKVHVAVDTVGHLLAVTVTPADEQERDQVGALAAAAQATAGRTIELAWVDQGYTGEAAARQAAAHGVRLAVIQPAEPKKGFVLLPRRWVVERTFGWLGRFRRLARDYERLATTLTGWHWVAAGTLMLGRLTEIIGIST